MRSQIYRNKGYRREEGVDFSAKKVEKSALEELSTAGSYTLLGGRP